MIAPSAMLARKKKWWNNVQTPYLKMNHINKKKKNKPHILLIFTGMWIENINKFMQTYKIQKKENWTVLRDVWALIVTKWRTWGWAVWHPPPHIHALTHTHTRVTTVVGTRQGGWRAARGDAVHVSVFILLLAPGEADWEAGLITYCKPSDGLR